MEETFKRSTIERGFQSYKRETNVSKYPRPPTSDPSQQIIRNESLPQNGTLAVVNSSAGDMQTLNENINTLMEKSLQKDANGKTRYRGPKYNLSRKISSSPRSGQAGN